MKTYTIRYDFGNFSRYSKSIPSEEPINTPSVLLYLGILIEEQKEIRKLFEENGLLRFEVTEDSFNSIT